MKVDKRILWQTDIACPHRVKEFISHEAAEQLSRQISAKGKVWFPPILLYYEKRGHKDKRPGRDLETSMLYGGHGSSQLTLSMSMHREIFHTISYNSQRQATDMDDRLRGAVLSVFCQLEFCIDTFLCIEMGLFNYEITESDMHEEMKENKNGLFGTTYKKVKYLKHKRAISNETYLLLGKARAIRNNLAHQFLPTDNFGVKQADYEQYGGFLPAIDNIFNGAWFYLLTDYSDRQDVVLDWLNNLLPETSS